MKIRYFIHRLSFFILFAAAAGAIIVFCADAKTIVTDAAGRKVEISRPVKRVVTTFKPATIFMLCLADPEILEGVDSPSRRDPLVISVAPGVAKLPGVGSKSAGISIEAVLKLNADLVVLYAHKDGVKMAERLADAGIPAIVIKPETFDSIGETINILAAATGRRDQGMKVIKAIESVMELVSTRIADIDPDKKKRVYYATPRGFLSTAPADMLQDQIIKLSGGINVASHLHGYFKNVSAEDLIKWRPEVITVSRSIKNQSKEMIKQQAFSCLPAVQTGDVYVFPSNLTPWDYPSPLSALAVVWLADKLYPEKFADISIMESINEFHKKIFGKTMSQMDGHLDDRLWTLPQTSKSVESDLTGTDKKP